MSGALVNTPPPPVLQAGQLLAGQTNLFVSGLPDGLDEGMFQQLFAVYGNIVSSRLIVDKKIGFVKMATPQEAQAAIESVNGMPFGNATLVVKYADNDGAKGGKGSGATAMAGGSKDKGDGKGAAIWGKGGGSGSWDSWSGGDNHWGSKNGSWNGSDGWGKAGSSGKGKDALGQNRADQVYIRGLPPDMDDNGLVTVFGPYCTIKWSRMLPSEGRPDGAGLVQTGSIEEASWLVQHLNGNMPEGLASPVHIQFSVSKSKGKGKGKDVGLSPYYGGSHQGYVDGEDGSNLYVKGLPLNADDLYLYKAFAPLGAIESVRMLSNEWGSIAFVKYVKVHEAQVAIAELNGKTLQDGTCLQVSVKKSKPKGGKGDEKGGKDYYKGDWGVGAGVPAVAA